MLSKKERPWNRAWRWAKILFFVANMIVSLLVCSPPLLVVFLDLLLPSVLLASVVGGPGVSAPVFAAQLKRGSYLGLAAVCGAASVGYASLKAVAMFGVEAAPGKRNLLWCRDKELPAVEILFLSSLALAVAHVVAAYRISCRERRKLLVYQIDIEAVSAYNNDFSNYHKIAVT